jgi:hypothetical protein
MNRNLVGSTYGRFCINRMKGERHRLSPLSLTAHWVSQPTEPHRSLSLTAHWTSQPMEPHSPLNLTAHSEPHNPLILTAHWALQPMEPHSPLNLTVHWATEPHSLLSLTAHWACSLIFCVVWWFWFMSDIAYVSGLIHYWLPFRISLTFIRHWMVLFLYRLEIQDVAIITYTVTNWWVSLSKICHQWHSHLWVTTLFGHE